MRTLKLKLMVRVVLAATLLTGTIAMGVETIKAGEGECQVCVEFDEGSGLCVGCCNWCTGWGGGGTGCTAHQEICACGLTGPICYIIE